MIKRIVIPGIIFFLSVMIFAQTGTPDTSEAKSDIPERISVSLDALLKTRTTNGIYSLKFMDSYFYVLKGSVYVNVLFSADLFNKYEMLRKEFLNKFEAERKKYNQYIAEKKRSTEEENRKIEEKNKGIKDVDKKHNYISFKEPLAPEFVERDHYFNLYMRVVKEGDVVQRFKAPVPFKGEKDTEYFSFGVILEPGKYDILVDINAFDNSEDGTLIFGLEVPELTLSAITSPAKSLTFSKPRFYNKIVTLSKPEKRFTVLRNRYQIGLMKQEFYPYTGDKLAFRASDTPILTFFIKGAKVVKGWNILTGIKILKGKKVVSLFKPLKLNNPYFFQPLKFVSKRGSPLKPGDYSISIKMHDNNARGVDGEVKVSFSITE